MLASTGLTAKQAPSVRLDGWCGMVRYRPRRPDLVPKQDGGKAQAGGDSSQNNAAHGRAPDAGSPSPGQHPSLQLVQVPAHPGSPFGLAYMLAAASVGEG